MWSAGKEAATVAKNRAAARHEIPLYGSTATPARSSSRAPARLPRASRFAAGKILIPEAYGEDTEEYKVATDFIDRYKAAYGADPTRSRATPTTRSTSSRRPPKRVKGDLTAAALRDEIEKTERLRRHRRHVHVLADGPQRSDRGGPRHVRGQGRHVDARSSSRPGVDAISDGDCARWARGVEMRPRPDPRKERDGMKGDRAVERQHRRSLAAMLVSLTACGGGSGDEAPTTTGGRRAVQDRRDPLAHRHVRRTRRAREERASSSRSSAINDAGGINGRPIELIIEDDATDEAKAVAAATKLIEQDGSSRSSARPAPASRWRCAATSTARASRRSRWPAAPRSPPTSTRSCSRRRGRTRSSCPFVLDKIKADGYTKIALISDTGGYGKDGRDVILKAAPEHGHRHRRRPDVQRRRHRHDGAAHEDQGAPAPRRSSCGPRARRP